MISRKVLAESVFFTDITIFDVLQVIIIGKFSLTYCTHRGGQKLIRLSWELKTKESAFFEKPMHSIENLKKWLSMYSFNQERTMKRRKEAEEGKRVRKLGRGASVIAGKKVFSLSHLGTRNKASVDFHAWQLTHYCSTLRTVTRPRSGSSCSASVWATWAKINTRRSHRGSCQDRFC